MPEGGFGHPYYIINISIDDRVTGVVRGCGEPWPGSTRSESPGSGAGPPGRKEFSSRLGSSFGGKECNRCSAKVTGSGIPRLPGRGNIIWRRWIKSIGT